MPSTGDDVAARVREIVLADFDTPPSPIKVGGKAKWARVKGCGSELWLDTGDIEDASSLWCAEFSAVTTNNTLLNREVQKGTYDALVDKVARELRGQVADEDLLLEVAFVLNAYHGLRISRELGAYVSVELHTDLAHDVERSVAYGRRYHAIAPERFYVKVPLTPAGLLAARQLSADGVPVNFTLGFSARQNYLIAALARPAFVNVFLGRLNSFVAEHGLGTGDMVGERATLASQQAVRELRETMRLDTRQIAASMREGEQVLALVGVDVLTMPTKVVRGFEELDPPEQSIISQVDAEPEVGIDDPDESRTLGLDVLWDVPDDVKGAVAQLLDGYADGISPEGLCTFFAEHGLRGLLPAWSSADIGAVTEDGKIPSLDRWRDRMVSREVGLDALMNVSGLQSFATDQAAMDERIKPML